MKLAATDVALLRAVKKGAGMLNLSGPRDKAMREVAYRLLESGYLSGVIKRLRLTPAGLAALTEETK